MRRLAIYATYNSKGIVDDYIVYMLQKLRDVAEDVCIVSNNTYLTSEKEKLSEATWIYEREDSGYDVGGYVYVIQHLQAEGKLNEYDELILLNDSIFGPFYLLSDVFVEMDKRDKDIDFWSITKRGVSDFDGSSAIYPEHLQIYFFVIKSRLLHSKEFAEYWDTIGGKITDFRSAIIKYEFAFTKHFENLGYLWDSYCKCEDFITENPKYNLSPYHYGMYELVRNEKCPFLKRKLFTGEFVEKKYTDSRDLRKAIDYIDNNTDYNIQMIWKHILLNYQITDIMKAMHMVEVINDESEEEQWTDIIANQSLINRIQISESNSEMIIKTDSLTIYFKFNKEILPKPLYNSYINNMYINLMCNKKYLCQIFNLFEKDTRLGIVIPPICTFGKISKSLEQKWIDTEKYIETKNKYKLSVPSSNEKAAIYEIQGFIARNTVITEELLTDIHNDDSNTILQMLPLFAQQKEYYTKIVINQKYVPAFIDNMTEIAETMWKTFTDDVDNYDIDNMNDVIYRKQLSDFLSKTKSVYIYGAGVLGYRIFRLIKNKTKIKGFLVTDTNGNPEVIDRITVQSIDALKDSNAYIIVAVGRKNNKTISALLKERGFENFVVIR